MALAVVQDPEEAMDEIVAIAIDARESPLPKLKEIVQTLIATVAKGASISEWLEPIGDALKTLSRLPNADSLESSIDVLRQLQEILSEFTSQDLLLDALEALGIIHF